MIYCDFNLSPGDLLSSPSPKSKVQSSKVKTKRTKRPPPQLLKRWHYENFYPLLKCHLFSCQDAAQQVLMYVCLSVSPSPKLKFYLWNTFKTFRMFQNACRTFRNVPECMQSVPECTKMHAEYSWMFQNACRPMSLHVVT